MYQKILIGLIYIKKNKMKELFLILAVVLGISACKKSSEMNPGEKIDTIEARFLFSVDSKIPVYVYHKDNHYKIGDSLWIDGVTKWVTKDTTQLHEVIHGNREKMIVSKLKR